MQENWGGVRCKFIEKVLVEKFDYESRKSKRSKEQKNKRAKEGHKRSTDCAGSPNEVVAFSRNLLIYLISCYEDWWWPHMCLLGSLCRLIMWYRWISDIAIYMIFDIVGYLISLDNWYRWTSVIVGYLILRYIWYLISLDIWYGLISDRWISDIFYWRRRIVSCQVEWGTNRVEGWLHCMPIIDQPAPPRLL